MDWSRRRVVDATIAATALAGCLGGDDEGTEDGTDASDTDDDETDASDTDDAVIDWDPSDPERAEEAESRIEAYDLVDYTGSDEETVQITVDPDAGSFDPAGFEVTSQTFIEWTWEGASEDIFPIAIPEECEWRGQRDEFAAGDSWDRLFWAGGAYIYGTRGADGEEITGAFRVHDQRDDDGNEMDDDGNEMDDDGMGDNGLGDDGIDDNGLGDDGIDDNGMGD